MLRALSKPGFHRRLLAPKDAQDGVSQKMPFLNAAFFLLGQLSEYLPQVLAKASVKHLAAAFGDKNNVVLALPPGVA
jgi:hypothetical protein